MAETIITVIASLLASLVVITVAAFVWYEFLEESALVRALVSRRRRHTSAPLTPVNKE